MSQQVIWRPNAGPQVALVKCPVDEIFYGGARGGGKTDGMLGKFAIKAGRYKEHATGVFFRRTREDLKEAIERSQQIYRPLGAKYSVQGKFWRFPDGARLKFEYLDKDKDAENYQGHNYTDLFFEELTHWADPAPINKLRATLRSAAGVPCQFHATGNPGGPGHHWVRERYIDPAPAGWEILKEDFENPFTKEVTQVSRVFIPSKLTDNPDLMADPSYVVRLQQSGSAALVKAWLEGDWSVIEGAFFDCWSTQRHVLRPVALPEEWMRFKSFDWGSAKPFSVGWWAIAQDDWQHPDGPTVPRGAMIRYREWYGRKGPNEGIKLTVEAVAEGIKEREKGDQNMKIGVADPAIFAADGGPSFAERFFKAGVKWKRADNKRVARNGAMGGWDQMRGRLLGPVDSVGQPISQPMIFAFSNCADSIRTIPVLQHDDSNVEDLDTDGEDHAADEWRYACMSRPYMPPKPVSETDKGPTLRAPTFNEAIARLGEQGERRRI